MKLHWLIAWLLASALFAADSPEQALAGYRAELDACRSAHGGARELPDVRFFLFGMGHRAKYVYRDGTLLDAATGRAVRSWSARREVILPSDYTVHLETPDGTPVVIEEDEHAVWMTEGVLRTAIPGTQSPVRLPRFEGCKYPRVLRVLHQELLFNLTQAGGPTPNLFVYSKPWYRDGAMVALALKETENLGLLRDWILGLREPFDRNNGGVTEPDNLGQALFLASLVSDKTHPVVARVMAELPPFEVTVTDGKFIKGKSDFAEHPVYQTKWLKFGLRALGLPDLYVVPKQADSYGALFWMGYRDQHVVGGDSEDRKNYPYLGWACDHFHGKARSPLSNRDYPLTWEKNASQANYDGMKVIAPIYAGQRLAVPHTWHAAEAFLLLLNEKAEGPDAR